MGSKYEVDRITVQRVKHVLFITSVKLANTARDLGVFVDRLLTMSPPFAMLPTFSSDSYA